MRHPRTPLRVLLTFALALSACATNDIEGEPRDVVPARPAVSITGGGATVITPKHRVEVMVTPGSVVPVKTPKHHIRLDVGAPRLAQKELAR